MEGDRTELVDRLFKAFNQRDAKAMAALCDPAMEFLAPTAEAVGHEGTYMGPGGLRDYLADAAQTWEELLVTSGAVEQRGDSLLVRGRVYVRSHEHGIRDMPVAWIWQLRGRRFVRGEVFPDPEEAIARFGRESG